MRLQNLHTHTYYCDGKDSPEAMVRRAVELGFSSLGFSGHIEMPMPTVYAMNEEKTAAYQRDILLLKEKYRGIIDIFLGIETDLLSRASTEGYDYVIGSSHYVGTEGDYRDVDLSLEATKACIAELYGGDPFAYARAYYENLITLANTRKFDFVGHFDLLNKFCEREDVFDVESRKYQSLALEALHAVKEKNDVFEVNTGAISRGYRKTPYPALFLLREMKEIGARLVITSDCHNAEFLDCGFSLCRELLLAEGFHSVLYFTGHGFEEEAL